MTTTDSAERAAGSRGRTQMAPLVPAIGFALLGFAYVFYVYQSARTTTMDFDEAVNLQVAQSLAERFAYAGGYVPVHVYDPRITTDGPIQYVAAFFFAQWHSPEMVIAGVCAVSAALLVAALFVLRHWLVGVASALLLLWPQYFYASVSFVGEQFALAFAIFGLVCLERALRRGAVLPVIRDNWFWAACVCFGIAVATKLLILLAILPIVFAIGLRRLTPSQPGMPPPAARVIAAAEFAAVAAAGALAVFVLQFAFSVWHTVRAVNIPAVVVALGAFVRSNYAQGAGASSLVGGIASQFTTFTSPPALLTWIAACVFLVVADASFALYVVVMLTLWLHYALNERRMLPFFVLTIAYAGRSLEPVVMRLMERTRLPRAYRGAALAFAGTILVFVISAAAKQPFMGEQAFAHPPAESTQIYHMTTPSVGAVSYSPALLDAVRHQRYVATSGFWQYPELSIHWGLHFYDRMAPENETLPRAQVALLFDRDNKLWPITRVAANCAGIIYSEGPIVLCRPRADVPLAYQPPAQ